jgi:serine protease inhibitor
VKLIIHAPYYKIKSDLDLTESIDKVGLEGLTTSALEKLVDPVEQEALACIKQCSLLKLDYNGFYAASATIVQNAGTAEPVKKEEVHFTLDHPYLFEVYHDAMPLYLGYVNDPGYPAA